MGKREIGDEYVIGHREGYAAVLVRLEGEEVWLEIQSIGGGDEIWAKGAATWMRMSEARALRDWLTANVRD
jgi:hypothetical protein